MILLVFGSSFVFTWVIPIACACACVASENKALDNTHVFNVLMFNVLTLEKFWQRWFHAGRASNLFRTYWEIENARIASRSGFLFEENSAREITWLSRCRCF